MGSGSWLIDRYVARIILAYLFLVVLFLTGALAAQQAGRLLEAISSTDAPADVVVNIIVSLLPTLLTLAVPMAVLLAVIIGLSQLGSDSEIIAIQAAGLGPFALVRPVLIISLLISGFALYLNLSVAPRAVRSLREIELKAVKYKLESPVEPHTFNTKIPDNVLYIRDGNVAKGVWQNVFIYHQKPDGNVRLITAKEGRIDFAKDLEGQGSELFLTDAVMLSSSPDKKSVERDITWSVDRAGQTRITFPTNRQEVLQRLQQRPFELDELPLDELKKLASGPVSPEQRNASVIAYKKFALSFGPLVLGLLGASLGVKVRRGGRGAGLVLGFIALVIYQLIALVGEQMARKGTVAPLLGVGFAPALALTFSIFWLLSRNSRFSIRGWWLRFTKSRHTEEAVKAEDEINIHPASPSRVKQRVSGYWTRFPAYLDWSAGRTLTIVFVLTLAILTFLFLTFTLFELWRFITPTREGYSLIARYLFFLLPLTLLQTLPGAGLIAAIATYALLARRLEAIAWWASGLSTYRLMLPAMLFALTMSFGYWLLQEKLMPQANIIQDTIRAQIKGTPKANTTSRQWLAPLNSTTIYSYNIDENQDKIIDLTIFLFSQDQTHLKSMLQAKTAHWVGVETLRLEGVTEIQIVDGKLTSHKKGMVEFPLSTPAEVFKPKGDKPSQLSSAELEGYLRVAGGRGEPVSLLATSLQAKYAAPFGTLALIMLGAPLALAFDRRKTLTALGAAVVASLLFWILTNVFQQFGIRGLLPPVAAGWTPAVIFGFLTVFLISRTKT